MESMQSALPSPIESLRGSAHAPKIAKNGTPEHIRAQAEEFEAFFLTQVLNSMFKGIKTDGMFGGGHGEEVYRDLQMQEFGKVIAKRGGVGIADAIVRQLLAHQEVKQ